MGFEVKVPGKWILAGEHSVLRGCPALVFPLYSRSLELMLSPDPLKKAELSLVCDGEFGEELQLLFWGVVEKGCALKKLRRSELTGTLKIKSSIPIGAGLGASAALCVAIAKWFQSMKMVQEHELYEFARTLEDLFHGESSGVDIAVALSGKGLQFVRHGERIEFQPTWQPKWFVSYSGKRGVTVECVKKVKELIAKDLSHGEQIDSQMKKAVELASTALLTSEEKGFPLLSESLLLARNCFEKWGLTQGALDQHMQWLESKGAVAVKPTGSGGGGYVLSLWKQKPDDEVLKRLIPCF